MNLLWFDIVATLIYAASMVCLLHEFRALTPEARHERQTVPMLLAVTVLYVVRQCSEAVDRMEYDNYRVAMGMITEIFDTETVKWERRKPFPLAFFIPILICRSNTTRY